MNRNNYINENTQKTNKAITALANLQNNCQI